MTSSRENYDELWKKIISPLISHYSSISWIEFSKTAREDIWEAYCGFNKHCKETYMKKDIFKIDGHKVAACYICAILKANPIKIKNKESDEENFFTVIEQFAITVGLSILRCFIVCDQDKNDLMKPDEILKKDKEIFDDGFVFPKTGIETNHGEYRNNFAVELYFTRKENNYNILSLSHSLYLLEMYNRQHWEIQQKSNS